MTVREEVQKGADFFEDAEKKAKSIARQARNMREVYGALNTAGVIGGLEYEEVSWRIEALTVKFAADLYEEHRRLTIRAQELGEDLPQPRSGGPR